MTVLTGERVCTKCGIAKPRTAEYFALNRRMADGLSSWCRDGYRANYRRHRDNRDRRRRTQREWELRNVERVRLSGRIKQMRRRALLRAATGCASLEQVMARVAFYGYRCWMCGAERQSIDHVIPLAKGGSNWPANLRPVCTTCNSRKQDRLPDALTRRAA